IHKKLSLLDTVRRWFGFLMNTRLDGGVAPPVRIIEEKAMLPPTLRNLAAFWRTSDNYEICTAWGRTNNKARGPRVLPELDLRSFVRQHKVEDQGRQNKAGAHDDRNREEGLLHGRRRHSRDSQALRLPRQNIAGSPERPLDQRPRQRDERNSH